MYCTVEQKLWWFFSWGNSTKVTSSISLRDIYDKVDGRNPANELRVVLKISPFLTFYTPTNSTSGCLMLFGCLGFLNQKSTQNQDDIKQDIGVKLRQNSKNWPVLSWEAWGKNIWLNDLQKMREILSFLG